MRAVLVFMQSELTGVSGDVSGGKKERKRSWRTQVARLGVSTSM